MGKIGTSLLAFLLTLLLVLSASVAMACSGGGGGGGGGSSGGGGGSSFNKMFDDDGGSFNGFEPSDDIAGGTRDIGPPPPDKYGETGDFGISHQTWAGIYNVLYGGAKVADVAGTIASFFIPGTGTYKVVKVANTIGKGYAFTKDGEKQAFVGKVLTGLKDATSNFGAPGPTSAPGGRRYGPPPAAAVHFGRRY